MSHETHALPITDEVPPLDVSVFGTGHVGLVQAVALAIARDIARLCPPGSGLPWHVPGALCA
ncbi:hypothetical protein FJD36_14460 [Pseudomonas chlororaphis subsp. chlororaphis]|nr:hypothetical protein FJD36_14460 [Pseudomonas chlororaphis subsp. chlororaphis]